MRGTRWTGSRRARSPLGALVTLIAIALIAGLAALLMPPSTLAGRAVAVDGDTLKIGETRIRLVGVDAVELDQICVDGSGKQWPCGREARAFLAQLSKGETTTCAATGRDRYRRILAHCASGEADLGEQLVRAGWATAELEYALALADARLNARGIWAGQFADPAEWRRSHGADTFDFWSWLMSLLGR